MIIMLCDGFMNTFRITKYDNKAIASDTEPRIGLPAASGFHRLRALRFTGVIDSTFSSMGRREHWHSAARPRNWITQAIPKCRLEA